MTMNVSAERYDLSAECQFWRSVYRGVSEGGQGDEWEAGEDMAHSCETFVSNDLPLMLTRLSASPHTHTHTHACSDTVANSFNDASLWHPHSYLLTMVECLLFRNRQSIVHERLIIVRKSRH